MPLLIEAMIVWSGLSVEVISNDTLLTPWPYAWYYTTLLFFLGLIASSPLRKPNAEVFALKQTELKIYQSTVEWFEGDKVSMQFTSWASNFKLKIKMCVLTYFIGNFTGLCWLCQNSEENMCLTFGPVSSKQWRSLRPCRPCMVLLLIQGSGLTPTNNK